MTLTSMVMMIATPEAIQIVIRVSRQAKCLSQ
ncbi:hypothetical protein ACVW1C_005344 [Bradyrhizobium sp. USDA 4011]